MTTPDWMAILEKNLRTETEACIQAKDPALATMLLALASVLHRTRLDAAVTPPPNDRAALVEASLEAAHGYISVSVCDPDTTGEMWEKYQRYQEAIRNLAAATAPTP